jgi:hypothetical protein
VELADKLKSELGITETQASGGAGIILQQAKEKLGAGEFSKLASAVPGIEKLISSAPAGTGGGGLLGDIGKIASSFGSAGSQAAGAASVLGGFSKLGLSPSMVEKFVPIILKFVESKGGQEVKSILGKVIK